MEGLRPNTSYHFRFLADVYVRSALEKISVSTLSGEFCLSVFGTSNFDCN